MRQKTLCRKIPTYRKHRMWFQWVYEKQKKIMGLTGIKQRRKIRNHIIKILNANANS